MPQQDRSRRQPAKPFQIPAERRREFEDLFHEFAASYPGTEKGTKHARLYEKARDEARKNFEEIRAARNRGEDVTELVLLKLLPHGDSKANRKRGAWVSPAPAIYADVKGRFRGLGERKAEDWPAVAKAILEFVESCVEDPERLEEFCAEFAANPLSKGFQTGMMTPILNALRPEKFLLVNNKSRLVINFLARTNFGQPLREYPKINRTGFLLIESLGSILATVQIPGMTREDVFDMFCHWLVAVKKYNFDRRYWKIAPGENAWNWKACLEGGYIAIGWEELGDLSKLDRRAFNERRDRLVAEKPDWTRTGADQAWKFAHIKEGDRVVANRGTREVLGIGTVMGAYYYVPGERHGHRLPVRWDDTQVREVEEPGWKRTLIELSAERFHGILDAAPKADDGADRHRPKRNPTYSLEQCADETGFDVGMLKRWVRAIHRKGQAIFYGPPGTGKTYMAEKLAQHLIGGGRGFRELIQFHPAYAYEEFIQGIRPRRTETGELTYELQEGRFLEFCRKAQQTEDVCVLIIDEINRANLSRVFGELMYLLEYRDRDVRLAGGDRFRIPSNVRIIGTMNTADRSIALVDHALRRRFAFIALRPRMDLLRHYHQRVGANFDPSRLISVLEELNRTIGDHNYEVGVTFFLRERLEEELEDIWRMEIEPYLEEYFFDQQAKIEQFRWEAVKERIGS